MNEKVPMIDLSGNPENALRMEEAIASLKSIVNFVDSPESQTTGTKEAARNLKTEIERYQQELNNSSQHEPIDYLMLVFSKGYQKVLAGNIEGSMLRMVRNAISTTEKSRESAMFLLLLARGVEFKNSGNVLQETQKLTWQKGLYTLEDVVGNLASPESFATLMAVDGILSAMGLPEEKNKNRM